MKYLFKVYVVYCIQPWIDDIVPKVFSSYSKAVKYRDNNNSRERPLDINIVEVY